MAIKIQKIGDISKIMLESGNIPKKMIFELSEDKTFYDAQLYYDFYNKDTDTTLEGYVSCKSKPDFINNFTIVPEQNTIFTLTIPDKEDN